MMVVVVLAVSRGNASVPAGDDLGKCRQSELRADVTQCYLVIGPRRQ